ncbi:hypothetical protein EON82_16765, partial [bacterium]
MEPKRQRAIWIGAGLFFVVAVGSGYLPDLMLRNEMAAAKAEGLVQPATKTPFVSSYKNAYVRYREIQSHYGRALARLRGMPTKAVSDPEVAKMLAEYVEASKRPTYQEPPPPDYSGLVAVPAGGPDENVRSNVSLAALVLAREATTESELAAAARMANHLRSADPAQIPNLDWTK